MRKKPVNSLQIRADRELRRIDRKVGKTATYMIPTGSTTDDAGDTAVAYTEVPVVVRTSGLSAIELSNLAASGFGQIDAVWKMRRAYVEDAQSDHILKVGPFYYQIMERGATFEDDALQILWKLFTRRRR